ncbi:hypothetical protein D9M69_218780 [compost metagenome]
MKKAARRRRKLLEQFLYMGGGFLATSEGEVEIDHSLSSLPPAAALNYIAMEQYLAPRHLADVGYGAVAGGDEEVDGVCPTTSCLACLSMTCAVTRRFSAQRLQKGPFTIHHHQTSS